MVAVFDFQTSPSGKGCAESGLCPPAQSQPSEGTRVLCVIVNRQCILLSPLLPHRNLPSDILQQTPPLCLPAAHLYIQKTKPIVGHFQLRRNGLSLRRHCSSMCCLYHLLAASPVCSLHPISCQMLIKNKGKG